MNRKRRAPHLGFLSVIRFLFLTVSASCLVGEFGRFCHSGESLGVEWSSYLGGSNTDGNVWVGIAADRTVVVLGNTDSQNFPSFAVPPATRQASDIYIGRFGPDGNILDTWFMGGSGNDYVYPGAVLDSQANLIFTGMTASSDFPTTRSFDNQYHGAGSLGYGDAHVTKIRSDGTVLWSTYLGGSGDEFGWRVATDSGGNVCVVGMTTSSDFPTSGGYGRPYSGGRDAFVAKFTADGRLRWSVYLGGSFEELGYGIAVDNRDDVYVAGRTASSTFPTSGPNSQAFHGGPYDVFFSKFTKDGQLAWSTCVGGMAGEVVASVLWDPAGYLHLTGETESSDFPTSGGRPGSLLGATDAFIATFRTDGTMARSFLLGGHGRDAGDSLILEDSGNLCLAGATSSSDFPTTGGGFSQNRGTWDVFFAKFDAAGDLSYSTYAGGGGQEFDRGVAFDSSQYALYVTGQTASSDFPTTHGWDRTFNGGSWDGFLTKFAFLSPTTETVESVNLVKDIYPGVVASSPQNLTDVNGTLFFSATDGSNGRELWKSDGTAARTWMIRNIAPAALYSNPSWLADMNGVAFFSADDNTRGQELWKSDGMWDGTLLVRDLHPSGASGPQNLVTIGTTVFFSADDGTNGAELWKSNGTAGGTVMVADIRPGALGSNPASLANVGGVLFFSADDGANGTDLWKSNGTAAGTVMVKDIYPGPAGSSPQFLTNVNGVLFFSADDSDNGAELWKSDGTASGTIMVKNISPSTSSYPQNLTAVNGLLFFSAIGTDGRELWRSDGTAAGTALVKNINPALDSNPMSLTNVYGTLFFSANDGSNGRELWRSDGTYAGTVIVKDIVSGAGSSSPGNFATMFGMLYFTAADGVRGTELWRSDGTASGTVWMKDIWPGALGSSPAFLTPVGNTLFFAASENVHGAELWSATLPQPWMIQEPLFTSGTQNTVSWTGGVGKTLYRIERAAAPDFHTPLQTIDASSSTLRYTFMGLTDGETYWYRVRGRNALGAWTAWSGPTFSTQDDTPPTVVLTSASPVWTNASPIPVTATFSEPVTGFGAASITRSNCSVTVPSGAGAVYTFGLVPTAQGAVTARVASGGAKDAAGLGNIASAVLTRNFDSLPPTGPAAISDGGAFTSSTTVRFDWPAATDGGAGLASYDLRIGTTPNGSELFNATVGLVQTYSVTAAASQTVYGHVRARDNAGNIGGWANSDGITVDVTRPQLLAAIAPNYKAVTVTFSEPVTDAAQASVYSCNRGLQILAAFATGDPRQFCLYTTAQNPGTSYTVTVAASTLDRASNSMDPARRTAAFAGGEVSAARQWHLYRRD